MKKFNLLLALILICSATPFAGAQRSSGPRIPFVDKGACPFECCTYRQWTVDKATLVRSAMSDTAPVSFRLKRGERVQGLTGVVITTRPGILRVLKDTVLSGRKLKKGDELYLLTYLGEGFNKIWFNGAIFEDSPYDEAIYKTVQEPKSTWWVKVKNRSGKIGWSRQPEHFGNMDQCGG